MFVFRAVKLCELVGSFRNFVQTIVSMFTSEDGESICVQVCEVVVSLKRFISWIFSFVF
jgi:hypothetical protein